MCGNMRRIQKLMKEWIFTGPAGKKRPVDLPHTWNAVDGQDGGNDYYRGICRYEKNFGKPEQHLGKYGNRELLCINLNWNSFIKIEEC